LLKYINMRNNLYIFLLFIASIGARSTIFDRPFNFVFNETIIRFNKETVAKKSNLACENQCKITGSKKNPPLIYETIQNMLYLLY